MPSDLRTRIDIRGDQLRHLAQIRDSQYKILKDIFGVRLHVRRGKVVVQGSDEAMEFCQKSIQAVLDGMDIGKSYTDEAFGRVCDFFKQQMSNEVKEDSNAPVQPPQPQRSTLPMVEHVTEGQRLYIQTMRSHVVTFSSGPAGSGKTFLAVGMAVQHLLAGQVEKIILVCPAVEAGEKLGFLPGDLNEKIRPYLLPLLDALRYFLGQARADHYAEKGVIEIAPLAYMRGRTLSDSFMILDEAQNTTIEQMKMFLTRIGKNSRAVVTGDISQIDLEPRTPSGLVHAMGILQNVRDVGFATLETQDILRHPVVGAIVKAYQREQEAHSSKSSEKPKKASKAKVNNSDGGEKVADEAIPEE